MTFREWFKNENKDVVWWTKTVVTPAMIGAVAGLMSVIWILVVITTS